MDKKVIFLDIDGTLVFGHEGVSKKVKDALSQVRENGHYVFLCTGRNRISVEPLLDIGFDGMVCSAGGYIEINGEKVFESHISLEDVHMIQDLFKQYHCLYIMEANMFAYQSDEVTRFLVLLSHREQDNSEIERLIEQQKKNFDIRPIEAYNDEPIQTICYMSDNMDDVKKLQEMISQKCQFLIYQQMDNQVINGEIMKKGVHKGTGVLKVMEALNLPIENSICFGDSMNDLEMIQTCHYGVVMDNGDPRLKEYASSVCESVENDGIYHELKRLSLI